MSILSLNNRTHGVGGTGYTERNNDGLDQDGFNPRRNLIT